MTDFEPPPLPDGYVCPVQRELAETGPVDLLTVFVFGIIVLTAGLATWLTRIGEKEDL